MASASKASNSEIMFQQSYKPESDSIKNMSRFFKIRDKPFVGSDLVKKGLTEANPNRSFYKTKLNDESSHDSLSDANVHVSNAVKAGDLVGVLSGVVLQKEENDLKRMEWPVLLINYVGQSYVSGLPEVLNPDNLTLQRVGRTKAEGNSVFILRPNKDNPLKSLPFCTDPSKHHNCIAKFILSDSHIFLCVIAKENIQENSVIKVFTQDIQLFESFGSWRGRQKTKPGDEFMSVPKTFVFGNSKTSTEPRTRYQKKQSKEEDPQEKNKEDVTQKLHKNVRRLKSKEENKTPTAGPSNQVDKQGNGSGKKSSKDNDTEQQSQVNSTKPLHRVVQKLRSNDETRPLQKQDIEDANKKPKKGKRSREELQEPTSIDKMNIKRVKSNEDTSKPNSETENNHQASTSDSENLQKNITSAATSNPPLFPEPSQMLKSKLDAATSTEEANVSKPTKRVLRPRKDNDKTTEQPKHFNSTKKILSKTQSVPVERKKSGDSSEKINRKTKRSEDGENQETEKKEIKKLKKQEITTTKPKSNSAPTAVLKEKLANINLLRHVAAYDEKKTFEHPRRPFENGRKFTLYHLGILIHQTEECPVSKDRKSKSLLVNLENQRRSRMNKPDIDIKFIKDWYEVFRGLFICEHVYDLKNPGCEEIKKFIKKKKEQCVKEFGYVSNDKGVLFILVFTSAFMDSLQIKLNHKEDQVNLINDIIIPVFEVEDRSAQRFFPLIILETSTGVHVWKQKGNKVSEFEYIRFSAGAPNEAVLEHHISFIVSELAKQLKTEYSDSNVTNTDLIRVLQRTKQENYKSFMSTEYELQKHKLCVEHSTTKPFTLDKPRDVEKDLEDDEVEGKFLLIQHCRDMGIDYDFEIMHNRIVKPMRHLKCKRAFPAISDYYDKDDKFKYLFDMEDAEINKAKAKVKINAVKNLNKVKNIKARLEDWNEISKRFPGLDKHTLRTMKFKEKYELTKERREEIMEEIKEAATLAVEDDTPYLVLIIVCRGKHEYFWLGELPPEDDPDFEKYICRYADIIDDVREAGLKKLFIIAGHYTDQHAELPRNMYKGQYPRNTIGGTPSTHHIRLKNLRIENSVPQHAILWAAPPGYQLPISKSKKTFSPLLDHFKQLMKQWPPEEEVNFDAIIQKGNKLSAKNPSGTESILLRGDDPDKSNPNILTHAQYYLANTIVFNHSWKIRQKSETE